jgi:7-cyano-7-deazaguanine reductase
MDIFARRAQLQTLDNPNKTIDYIITLETRLPKTPITLTLRYIPDKFILDSRCFDGYITDVAAQQDLYIETLAATVVEDFNNELVTKWVQVIAYEDLGDSSKHNVVIEDKQPRWDNPHLLARLSKI